MQIASWFLLREPQDPTKKRMHLQLTEKGAHVSYVDKGVTKQNVKGKRKMLKKKNWPKSLGYLYWKTVVA